MNILIHLLKLSIFSIPTLFLSRVSSREHQQLGMCNKIYQSRSKNAIISAAAASANIIMLHWILDESILSFPQVNANCAADKTQIHISNRKMQSEHHVSLMSNKWDGSYKKNWCAIANTIYLIHMIISTMKEAPFTRLIGLVLKHLRRGVKSNPHWHTWQHNTRVTDCG